MYLLLHDDWEVNGDGTGNPERLMFEPARRLLDLCDRYGAYYTLFAEVMQQFAMGDSPNSRHRRWAAEWERVIRDAVARGHDVQLHLHPQWIDARYRHGKWWLNYSKWSIAGLDEEEIFELLDRGKRYLESVLTPVRTDYEVLAFRAGGWMAQPSFGLVRALRRAGIVADCSVVPGKMESYVDHGTTDYTRTVSPLLPWWVAEENVANAGTPVSGVIELPSYTEKFRLPLPLHLVRGNLRSLPHYWRIGRRKREKERCRGFSPKLRANGAGQGGLAGFFAPRSTYCSFGYMHYRTLLGMTRNALRLAESMGARKAPMVMLTHSKSFYSFSNFERFLQELKAESGISFSRTRDYVRKLAACEVRGLPLVAGDRKDFTQIRNGVLRRGLPVEPVR